MRPISSLELPPTNAAAHFVLAAGPGAQPASAPARLPLRSPGSPSAGIALVQQQGALNALLTSTTELCVRHPASHAPL